MDGLGLAIYILLFPTIAVVVTLVIWRAAYREYRGARRQDDDLL